MSVVSVATWSKPLVRGTAINLRVPGAIDGVARSPADVAALQITPFADAAPITPLCRARAGGVPVVETGRGSDRNRISADPRPAPPDRSVAAVVRNPPRGSHTCRGHRRPAGWRPSR